MDEAALSLSETYLARTTVVRRDPKRSSDLFEGLSGFGSAELSARYRAILDAPQLDWTELHKLKRRLGAGGQGVVFLGERQGADGFRLPVALKIFSPDRYEDGNAYDEAMGRMSRVAARVARIQQDHLLDVQNFVSPGGIRVMEMEWIDGRDLRHLLTTEMLTKTPRQGRPGPLGLPQRRDRDGRSASAPPQAGNRDRHPARLPRRPLGLAPPGDRPRRHQAVQHHAQADREPPS